MVKKKKSSKRSIRSSLQKKLKPPEYGLTDKISRLFYTWIRNRTQLSDLCLKAAQYEIKEMICEGTFGQIMLAINVNTGMTVAAKLELMGIEYPQLETEFKLYELLGSEKPGFIKIFYHGPCDRIYNVLIMDLLGPDLEDLFKTCHNTFSHKTVLMIALQTLKLIQYIHSKQIIYRDIKPENFCIGNRYQNKERLIYIIDFGLSKLENSKKRTIQTEHLEYHYLIGTARYMSVNAHFGQEQSKRDDLESLLYMYSYFILGKLPWMDLPKRKQSQKYYEDIALRKVHSSTEELFKNYPEFVEIWKYIMSLKFQQEPNYKYMQNVISSALKANRYENDSEFDWTSIMNTKFLKQALDIDPDY